MLEPEGRLHSPSANVQSDPYQAIHEECDFARQFLEDCLSSAEGDLTYQGVGWRSLSAAVAEDERGSGDGSHTLGTTSPASSNASVESSPHGCPPLTAGASSDMVANAFLDAPRLSCVKMPWETDVMRQVFGSETEFSVATPSLAMVPIGKQATSSFADSVTVIRGESTFFQATVLGIKDVPAAERRQAVVMTALAR